MALQLALIVPLWRDLLDLREPRPGDIWEIVVLVVEADIVGEDVERAVVRVGLLVIALFEGVVLGCLGEGRSTSSASGVGDSSESKAASKGENGAHQ